MEVASCSQSSRTQLIEYDEGLQRTPELERRQQSSVACRFLHAVPYHTTSSITAVAATGEEQVSHQQRANHDDDSQSTHEAEAAAVGCCCCCRYGSEGALPTNENKSRMTKK